MPAQNTWYLECKKGTSNKFYEVRVTSSAQRTHRYTIETEYGPIGSVPRKGKAKVFYSQMEARRYAHKVVREKKAKGYKVVDKKTKKTTKEKITKKRLNKPVDPSLKRFSSLLAE